MNVLDLLHALCPEASWRPWATFLRSVYGLFMDALDVETFRRHTNRITPRPGGCPEAVRIVGRQSGKSRIAGLIADFEALRGTSGTYAVVVAQDLRGALRAVSSCARQPFRDLDA